MTTMTETPVPELTPVRPLSVLVPLIKEDLAEAEEAGKPYWQAAGEKLIEAREGHFKGKPSKFFKWSQKTFGKSSTQIRAYIAATSVSGRKSFKSLEESKRDGKPNRYDHTIGRRFRDWTAPVDDIAGRAREESRRIAREEHLTRIQERDAEKKLALRLIDIGYKVLAKTLHPDKMGGSRDAMTRLNRVRDRLKTLI